MSGEKQARRLSFELLESRRVLSFTLDFAAGLAEHSAHHEEDHLEAAEAKGGGGRKTGGPEIDLPTVVAHELGHSLGLGHSNDASCGTANQPIMCAYYIGPAFRLQAEDVSRIRSLYPNSSVVQNSADGRWDDPNLTYSFMPDGSSIDQGGRKGSELFSAMQKAIGENWQSVFRQALNLWAEATDAENLPDPDPADNALKFTEVGDDGSPFNFVGNGTGQGDAGVGDIRFGSHKFDGPGGVLAHAYFPPPNGATAAGDAHFAKEENWKNLSSLALTPGSAAAVAAGSDLTLHGRSGLSHGAAAIRSSTMEAASNFPGTPVNAPAGPSTEVPESVETQERAREKWSAPPTNVSVAVVAEAVASDSKSFDNPSENEDLAAALDALMLDWPSKD